MIAEKLRRAVIQKAIEGNLFNIESEDKLIEPTYNTKKFYKKEKTYSEFSIPKNWIWTTLSRLFDKEHMNDGDWIVSNDMSQTEEIKLIQLGSIGKGKFINKEFKHISNEKFNELNCKEIKPNYLLFNRIVGGGINACIIPEDIDGKIITSVDALWIKPSSNINLKFIMYLLLSPYLENQINKLKAGTTRQRISKFNLINIPIPLPNIKIQNIIVEKLEVLLAEIDKLEQDEKALKELEDKFPEKLKTSILQAAIEGKLVDNSTHESAVNELDKKTQRLYFSNKDKYRLPFAIPKTWISMPIFERYYFVKTGLSNYEGEKKYFSTGSIKEVFKPEGLYTFENRPSRANRLVLKGDIIEAKMSNTIKTTIVNEELDNQLVSTGFFQIRTNNETTTKYIYYLLQSPYFINIKNELSSGTTQKAINDTNLRKIIVPIPPLEEQKRIVEKLDELFSVDLLNGI